VTEKCDRVSLAGTDFSRDTVRALTGENDPVNGAAEQSIGPVREEVANVDQNGRSRIVCRSIGAHGHRCPYVVLLQDLETCLTLEAEEEGDGAVV
jgi:hypothetical protein